MANPAEMIGSKITLTTASGVRYEGKLFAVDFAAATITVANGWCVPVCVCFCEESIEYYHSINDVVVYTQSVAFMLDILTSRCLTIVVVDGCAINSLRKRV